MSSCRDDLLSGSGWTPVPNELLDKMSEFDPVQFKIALFLVRRLYGYKTPRDDFSVRFISDNTGLPRSTVQRHLTMMISNGIVAIVGRGKKGARRLSFSMRTTNRDTAAATVRAPIRPPVPSRAWKASRYPGQVQIKHPKQNVHAAKTSFSHSEIFLELERTLSSSSFRKIQSAFLGEECGYMRFSADLPDSLRFMLDSILDKPLIFGAG